jgi:hypothetical protein
VLGLRPAPGSRARGHRSGEGRRSIHSHRVPRYLLRQAPKLALGLVVFLQGCAGLGPGKPPAPAAVTGGESTVLVQKGRPGIVIGAPHGALDTNTDLIAGDLARLTGFSLVVAKGASIPDPGGRALGTDRVVKAPARLEDETRGGRSVDQAYQRRVAEASQGPLGLYVEVDGSGRGDSAGRVEITTVGLSRDDAWRVKTLFELIRDARLDDPTMPRLEVRVESVDPIRSGLLAEAARVLQIELPGAARTTYREIYTTVLGAFLSESVTFLLPRAR